MKSRDCIIGIILLVLDQELKNILIDKNIVFIPNILNFKYTKNYAAAFGLGSKYIILFFSIFIIIFVLYYLIKNKDNIKYYLPYILVISGSFSNLIDRVNRGYVVDYLEISFIYFPIFNIADVCIVVGTFIIIADIIIKSIKKNKI